MKILVVGPSWVGDMMMSQSLYRTLRARYPQAIIDVMAPAWCRPLLSRMPEVNEAIPMPLGHGALAIGERRKLGHSLRERRYDRAYVLPNSFKSALVPFFANIPLRTGWRGEMRYGLLNDARVLDKDAWPLMVERYVALAYDNGVCPGAEFGPAKRWPHYHYAALAKKLIDDGYQIALFGSAKDNEAGKEIIAALSSEQQAWCRNLAGETQLEQAVILIAACKAVVTNDSGLMHVAAALDRPLVALYGPSSPDFTPPLSHKARVIRLITGYHKVRKGDAAEGYHQSLIDITPERVLQELNELLAEKTEHEEA